MVALFGSFPIGAEVVLLATDLDIPEVAVLMEE
jgi:hypothetical protein